MNLGPANNTLTILSFGRPFEEIAAELNRSELASLSRGIVKVKGLIPDEEMFWFTPNPVKGRGGSGGGGGKSFIDVTDPRVRKTFVPSNVFEKPSEGKFDVYVDDKLVYSSGGRQSSDGKEIITGDTVEGDDAPQVPDDKEDKNAYQGLKVLTDDFVRKSLPEKYKYCEMDESTIEEFLGHTKGIWPKSSTGHFPAHWTRREKLEETIQDTTTKSPYGPGKLLSRISVPQTPYSLEALMKGKEIGEDIKDASNRYLGTIVGTGVSSGRTFKTIALQGVGKYDVYDN